MSESLKAKAKTTYEIWRDYEEFRPSHTEWVLLSDAEAEIQQLKKEIENFCGDALDCCLGATECQTCQNADKKIKSLEDKFEAVKTILKNNSWNSDEIRNRLLALEKNAKKVTTKNMGKKDAYTEYFLKEWISKGLLLEVLGENKP